jgi:hypothetical protein
MEEVTEPNRNREKLSRMATRSQFVSATVAAAIAASVLAL